MSTEPLNFRVHVKIRLSYAEHRPSVPPVVPKAADSNKSAISATPLVEDVSRGTPILALYGPNPDWRERNARAIAEDASKLRVEPITVAPLDDYTGSLPMKSNTTTIITCSFEDKPADNPHEL